MQSVVFLFRVPPLRGFQVKPTIVFFVFLLGLLKERMHICISMHVV